MKIEKAEKRDKKIHNRKYGHRVDGKSIFIIYENDYKRAEKKRTRTKKNVEKFDEDF